MTHQVENFSACPERQPVNTDNLCNDVYKPENRSQFCGPKKPEHNCNSDDDFNNFFSNNLNNNIYDGGCVQPADNHNGLKNIDKGQKYLNRASNDLDEALRALENGNTRGAQRELEEALKRSGKAVGQFDKAVDKHKGGGINGAYGEDGIKDGTKEINGSREDIKDALELLKCGKTGEAMEAIRNAKKEMTSGGEEVQAGEDALRGKKPVNTPRGREAASDREFKEGAKEFDRTGDALEDALNSLDHGDKSGALRDLERSQRNLDQGQNNYKDGLRLNQTGDESLIKKGLDTSKSVDQSIDAAMDLVKCGCTREAKQMIEAALKQLDKSQDQLTRGVDKQDDNGDQHCGNGRDRNDNRGRDIDFPSDYRPSNPNWRDRLNGGNGDNDRIGLFPGEFKFKFPLPPLPGRDFNPFDPAGLTGKDGPLNFLPTPPNPFDLFGGGDNDGPLNFLPKPPNPLDIVSKLPNPIEELQPKNVIENITRPDKVIKKIFGGLF